MKDSFRPAPMTIPFDISGLMRAIYQIQELNQRSLQLLENLKQNSHCKIVTFYEEDHKIVIVGDDKSLQDSKRVIMELFNLPTENEKATVKITLSVYFANKLRGKNNYKLNYIRDKYHVSITELQEGDNILFTIIGAKPNVEDAREQMQIKEESIKLTPEARNYFNEMNEYSYRRFFFDKNIVLFNLDNKNSVLYVIGCEKSLQNVKESISEKFNAAQATAKHYKKKY
jgi:phosphoheptose isomerase